MIAQSSGADQFDTYVFACRQSAVTFSPPTATVDLRYFCMLRIALLLHAKNSESERRNYVHFGRWLISWFGTNAHNDGNGNRSTNGGHTMRAYLFTSLQFLFTQVFFEEDRTVKTSHITNTFSQENFHSGEDGELCCSTDATSCCCSEISLGISITRNFTIFVFLDVNPIFFFHRIEHGLFFDIVTVSTGIF